eukprot:13891111-Ditylum_brightwellii.AAC.1
MGAENIVVEMCGDIFKGKADVCAWVECNLPDSYPFDIFVDVHVIMEPILIGHINFQATTMEHNIKLKLKADEAL